MIKLKKLLNTRIGLLLFLLSCLWIKSMIAYFSVFNLRGVGIAEFILMIVNPIGFTAICFTILLFIRRTSLFYLSVFTIALLLNFLLYLNVLYYREFTDFVTIDTLTGGAGVFQHGFDVGSVPVHILDFVFWIDIVVIVILLLLKKIKFDTHFLKLSESFSYFSLSVVIFVTNFWFAEFNKHQLISRRAQSDKTYVVRYLGLGPWMLTDSYYTHVIGSQRKEANRDTVYKIKDYIKNNRHLAPNTKMFGIAKNRNLIVIHLESFQQDLIDRTIKGTDGKTHVVTPFLNSIYHSQSTYSFSNFFNQVGQGKTADAENMMETSTFGLPAGAFFSKYGSSQTFQAMPAILKQQEGYSSAVFHGNVGSFYNRLNTYKQMGYENFFDQSFYNNSSANMSPWGIKDKLLFRDSIPMLEKLQQPFYVKYLTVTNHLIYTMANEDRDPSFATVDSGDSLVNKYFETAHYLDQSVQQFYDYLKKSGLYKKSTIVLYGDHYGISGSDLKAFAPYIGSSAKKFTSYDNTMLQRTPLMIDIPGHRNGRIIDTYSGEIDVMPTLEHLQGISNKNYIQFGQDIFSKGRKNFVALRNGGFVTPTLTLTSLHGNYYNTQTGTKILKMDSAEKKYAESVKKQVSTLLSNSDKLNNGNLLRFYQPNGFTKINPKDYNYTVAATEKKLIHTNEYLAAKSNSLFSHNNNQSTLSYYTNDIPEVRNSQDVPKIK